MKEDEAHPKPIDRNYVTDEDIFIKYSEHPKLSSDELF